MINQILQELTTIRHYISENYTYVCDASKVDTLKSGKLYKKISGNPNEFFDYLEYIFDAEYVDIYKERGVVFVDDKVTWDFLIKTSNGYFQIHDWKGYSISIKEMQGHKIEGDLKEDVDSFITKILLNVHKMSEFKEIEAKEGLDSDPFGNFHLSMAALTLLLDRSRHMKEYGSPYLEQLMLLVSLIDCLLRYAILVHRVNVQKVNAPTEDMLKLFYQEGDEYISERKIIQLAEAEIPMSVISKYAFFEKLNFLYDERNRAVHRFAITSVQYENLKNIISELESSHHVISTLVKILEQEQVRLSVGWLTKESISEIPQEEINNYMDIAYKMKVNPSIVYKEKPDRDPMFSDKYEGGVNPKIKHMVDAVDGLLDKGIK